MARVREQGGGLGSPIRHDVSFMSSSNASYGNGSRSRASGKVPTPPLFSSDEADRDKPGYTEHVFEWVRCMRDYVEFNETDEIRQAQLAISYLKGSAEAAARAHMAKRDSTWQSLQAYLLTTMITPAHVARLRRELNSFEAMRGKNSVKGMVEKFQVLERKINSLPEVHKEYCTMHWKTMLEYLKEGLPEGCVATLNQSPPESMEAAHEEILSWARAHQPLPDTPTPARLQFVQDEGVECEDCGEVFAIGEKCYKCGGMGHYARDVECPQHPNHTAQHPNHTAPPFTFAGAQTRTGGGFRGGARAERRGMARGGWRGGQRGWRAAPYTARPAMGRLQMADSYEPTMRYEDEGYVGQEMEVVAVGSKHGHAHMTPTYSAYSATHEGTKRAREESYTPDTRELITTPYMQFTHTQHPPPRPPGNGGRGPE